MLVKYLLLTGQPKTTLKHRDLLARNFFQVENQFRQMQSGHVIYLVSIDNTILELTENHHLTSALLPGGAREMHLKKLLQFRSDIFPKEFHPCSFALSFKPSECDFCSEKKLLNKHPSKNHIYLV